MGPKAPSRPARGSGDMLPPPPFDALKSLRCVFRDFQQINEEKKSITCGVTKGN